MTVTTAPNGRRPADGPDAPISKPQTTPLYAQVPVDLIHDRHLTGTDIRVYAYLDAKAGRRGYFWDEQQTIADGLGISVRQVRISVRKLAGRGYVWTERTGVQRRTVLCYYVAARNPKTDKRPEQECRSVDGATGRHVPVGAEAECRSAPEAECRSDRKQSAGATPQITSTDHPHISVSPDGQERESDDLPLTPSGRGPALAGAEAAAALIARDERRIAAATTEASPSLPPLDGPLTLALPDERPPNWTEFLRALKSRRRHGIRPGDSDGFHAKCAAGDAEPPITLTQLFLCFDLADTLRRAFDKETIKLPSLSAIADFALCAEQWAAYCRLEPRAADPAWVRDVFRKVDRTEGDERIGYGEASPVAWAAMYPTALVTHMRQRIAEQAERQRERQRTSSRIKARVRDLD